MAQLPAVCRTCGTVFPSGFDLQHARNVTFEDCVAGPCPKCGGDGDIPNGIYDFVGDTIRVLAAPTTSAAQLRRIADVLHDARERRSSRTEVARAVEDVAPGTSLAQRFLIPRNPGEFYALLGIILAAITLLIMAKSAGSGPDEGDIERIVRDAIEEVQVRPSANAPPSSTVASPPTAAPTPKASGQQPKKAKRPKNKPGRRDHRRRR